MTSAYRSIAGSAGSTRSPRRLVLALGSGGTRGFAHLGVIKALLDDGLRIDAISGASAGALFGSLFAMDGTPQGIKTAMSVSPREIAGLFRDRLRLAASNPLGARIAEYFAGARLELLPVPMTVLTVDLETGREIVLREGRVRDAIEASIAIPLLARPVAVEGRYLIDGGYGRHGPTIGARATGDEVVVMVWLGEIGLCPPRLRGLARRIAHKLHRPREDGPPDWRAVLRRAVLANSCGLYEAHDADLVITPSVDDINRNSPFAAHAAFRRGERAAREAMPQLRRLLAGEAEPPVMGGPW